jgi:hypothetical protein
MEQHSQEPATFSCLMSGEPIHQIQANFLKNNTLKKKKPN